MLTPFFNKAQIAGGVASMATIVFGFLYLAISLTRYSLVPDGYLSTIPSWGQWLLALFSPVALALSIDQASDQTHSCIMRSLKFYSELC